MHRFAVCGPSACWLHVVMQLNDAVRKTLRAAQAERHVTMPWRNQGNAFANEYRHNADDELVDGARVEKRPDDLTSAHHPDVLAGLFAETLGENADRLGDELDTGRDGRRGRAAREDVVHVIGAEARTQFHTHLVRLATENFGIEGP